MFVKYLGKTNAPTLAKKEIQPSLCKCPFDTPYTDIKEIDTSRIKQIENLGNDLLLKSTINTHFDINKYIKVNPNLSVEWNWEKINETTKVNGISKISSINVTSKEKFENLYFLTVLTCNLYKVYWCEQKDTLYRDSLLEDYRRLSLSWLNVNANQIIQKDKSPKIISLIYVTINHNSHLSKIEFNGKELQKLPESNKESTKFRIKGGIYKIALMYYDGSYIYDEFHLTKNCVLDDKISFQK